MPNRILMMAVCGAFALGTMVGARVIAQTKAPERVASEPTIKFLSGQRLDQFVFTKFKGTELLGAGDTTVGFVNDLVFDGTGKVGGVVVAIGGLFGIGTKNLAIDLAAFEIVPAGSASGFSVADANDLSNVKLKVSLTKDQLREAPTFMYHKTPKRTGSTPSPATSGAGPTTPLQPLPQTE